MGTILLLFVVYMLLSFVVIYPFILLRKRWYLFIPSFMAVIAASIFYITGRTRRLALEADREAASSVADAAPLSNVYMVTEEMYALLILPFIVTTAVAAGLILVFSKRRPPEAPPEKHPQF
ncbi:hypothetical protein [Alkalicoccus luteus]|uniref:hypothetical protein n=1 Tax=Alkalicoccus luteus TaxID=1237094 RepID=UPI004033659E